MNIMMFYLGALALFGLSAILIRDTSPFSRMGCATYERKRRRWLMGVILLIMATLALGIGMLAHFFSGSP